MARKINLTLFPGSSNGGKIVLCALCVLTLTFGIVAGRYGESWYGWLQGWRDPDPHTSSSAERQVLSDLILAEYGSSTNYLSQPSPPGGEYLNKVRQALLDHPRSSRWFRSRLLAELGKSTRPEDVGHLMLFGRNGGELWFRCAARFEAERVLRRMAAE